MKILNLQDIHQLAMLEVGKYLEIEGYEFLAVNSQIKRSPQFVCVKDKILYFVMVQGCLYPNSSKDFAHANDYEKPLTKNDPYVVNFDGLQTII